MKTSVFTTVGLLLTTFGVLSTGITDKKILTYALLITGLILCIIAVVKSIKNYQK